MGPVAEPLADGHRVWFSDARTPARRMAISTHPEAGVVVISLWSGDVCTNTFRLPLDDAPGVIAVLADGLGAARRDPELRVVK